MNFSTSNKRLGMRDRMDWLITNIAGKQANKSKKFYRVVEQETERESLSKSQERKRKDIRLGIEKDIILDQLRYQPKKN